MSIRQVAILILYSLGMLCGQALFKLAAQGHRSAAEQSFVAKAIAILFNGYFILAAILYMALSVLWVWILQMTPISRAYPFVAMNFVFVAVMGVLFFSERLTPINWLGVIVIVAGVVLVTLGD